MLPGSLGPKPTANQLKYLRLMADGYELHYSSGIRFNSFAYFVKQGVKDHIKTRVDFHHKFYTWGWITPVRSDFMGTDYVITANGRTVAEKGEIRK
jgi:hypothetical protein